MATEPTAAPVTFSSPSMRARAYLVRGLAAVDELERAWARRDYWTARGAARTAQEHLDLARLAFDEAWTTTGDLETADGILADVPPGMSAEDMAWLDQPEPETEAEARQAWGDR